MKKRASKLETHRMSPTEFWVYRSDETIDGGLRLWGQAFLQAGAPRQFEARIPACLTASMSPVSAIQFVLHAQAR